MMGSEMLTRSVFIALPSSFTAYDLHKVYRTHVPVAFVIAEPTINLLSIRGVTRVIFSFFLWVVSFSHYVFMQWFEVLWEGELYDLVKVLKLVT